jgi:chaperonin GroEL (HSP60 family)
VPGGGLALLRCVKAVTEEEPKCDGDEKTGVEILKRALEVAGILLLTEATTTENSPICCLMSH